MRARISEQGEARFPAAGTLAQVSAAARDCQACPLYQNARQTVFGEGPADARLVLIGEQPGDQEDWEGRPFIGPAGQLLNRALAAAGIKREECYVTNAVKHFKWEPSGKRRIHQKPTSREIAACQQWWQAELQLIHPETLVCLGSTAARAVFGREVKILRERGRILETRWANRTLITVHPSSLLRIPDPEAKTREFTRFVHDLASLGNS